MATTDSVAGEMSGTAADPVAAGDSLLAAAAARVTAVRSGVSETEDSGVPAGGVLEGTTGSEFFRRDGALVAEALSAGELTGALGEVSAVVSEVVVSGADEALSSAAEDEVEPDGADELSFAEPRVPR